MDPLAFDGIGATITVTQSASGTFAAAVQLTGPSGEALLESRAVRWYLSKNSDGSTVATTSTDVTTLAAGTDGLVIEDDSNVSGVMVGAFPIEELLFGFGIGAYWSGVYEHLAWHHSN